MPRKVVEPEADRPPNYTIRGADFRVGVERSAGTLGKRIAAVK